MNEGVYFCTPRNEVGQGKTESINVQIGSKYSFVLNCRGGSLCNF